MKWISLMLWLKADARSMGSSLEKQHSLETHPFRAIGIPVRRFAPDLSRMKAEDWAF